MDAAKILEVVGRYREDFSKNDIPAIHFPHTEKPIVDIDILAHCHWMLDDIEKLAKKEKLGKAKRWLGFIQGCLWSVGWYTIDDLRNHNKPEQNK